jgi:HSP20 family protein
MEVLKSLGQTVRHGWQELSEGWRELLNRGSSSITRFFPRDADEPAEAGGTLAFPRWGLIAGEVIDHGDSVIVQLEVPGVRREDCQVSIEQGYLHVDGQKHWERDYAGATYRLMERAYGEFRRTVALPPEADPDSARAALRDGVLKVELKKKPGAPARRHKVEVQ